mmetsp:Transcript_27450/g.88227  ORF Transcript_27450/g.88227 Transcript_27450/m.88227 type:complete len:253 (+) Transcript_27450:289-1047(+)
MLPSRCTAPAASLPGPVCGSAQKLRIALRPLTPPFAAFGRAPRTRIDEPRPEPWQRLPRATGRSRRARESWMNWQHSKGAPRQQYNTHSGPALAQATSARRSHPQAQPASPAHTPMEVVALALAATLTCHLIPLPPLREAAARAQHLLGPSPHPPPDAARLRRAPSTPGDLSTHPTRDSHGQGSDSMPRRGGAPAGRGALERTAHRTAPAWAWRSGWHRWRCRADKAAAARLLALPQMTTPPHTPARAPSSS